MCIRDRYSLEDDGSLLVLELTIRDPNYYREPWTVRKRYNLIDAEIQYYECIVRPHIEPGV